MRLHIQMSKIDGSPGFLLHQAFFRMKHSLFLAFKKKGFSITHEHWSVLRLLWKEDRLSQARIAEKLKKDRPNITRIVDVLVKNGYAKRTIDPDDRRIQNVSLTRKGKSIQETLTESAMDVLDQAFAGVSQEDYDTFMNILNKVIQNLNHSHHSIKKGETP